MKITIVISAILLFIALLAWRDRSLWQFFVTSTEKFGEDEAREDLVKWINGCTRSIKIVVGRVNLKMYDSKVVTALKNLIVHRQVQVEIICEVGTLTKASLISDLILSKLIRLYRSTQPIKEHFLIGDDYRYICWDSDERPAKPYRLSFSNDDAASVKLLLTRFNKLMRTLAPSKIPGN